MGKRERIIKKMKKDFELELIKRSRSNPLVDVVDEDFLVTESEGLDYISFLCSIFYDAGYYKMDDDEVVLTKKEYDSIKAKDEDINKYKENFVRSVEKQIDGIKKDERVKVADDFIRLVIRICAENIIDIKAAQCLIDYVRLNYTLL